MASLAAALPALFSIGGSIGSSLFGSSGVSNATNAEVQAGQQGIQELQGILGQQAGNQSPFIGAGQSSIAQLMSLLQSGKLGPGSLGPVPTAPGAFTGTFAPPTLQEAQQTPGYQFTAQQGSKGIAEGAAAAGGAVSGGTLKALDQYNTGLADTTYNDVFNRALSTYGTALQGYQANLTGYGAQLAGYNTGAAAQQQGFQQLFAPVAAGETAASGLNQNLGQGGIGIAQLMAGIGNAQAAGSIGQGNIFGSLIGGLGNTLGQAFSPGGGSSGGNSASIYGPGGIGGYGPTLPGGTGPGATGGGGLGWGDT